MPPLLSKLPELAPIFRFIETQPRFDMTVMVVIFYVLALGALTSATDAFQYRFVGPSRLGSYDVPQPQVEVGCYKRQVGLVAPSWV